MKKKILVFLAVTFLFALLPLAAYASEISVTIEGERVHFPAQPPAIVDGRVLVPVRGVFEALGFEVGWDAFTRTVTLTDNNYTVYIIIDSPVFITNGTSHTLDVPAQIINGSTMLPIRQVLESVGYEVEWNNTTRTVMISAMEIPDSDDTVTLTYRNVQFTVPTGPITLTTLQNDGLRVSDIIRITGVDVDFEFVERHNQVMAHISVSGELLYNARFTPAVRWQLLDNNGNVITEGRRAIPSNTDVGQNFSAEPITVRELRPGRAYSFVLFGDSGGRLESDLSANIVLTEMPFTQTRIDTNGRVISTVTIDSIDVEQQFFSGNMQATVSFSGVFDNPAQTEATVQNIGWRLEDANGNVVTSGTASTPRVNHRELFTSNSFTIRNLVPGRTYFLRLVDVANW
jgi:hypothetical protein